MNSRQLKKWQKKRKLGKWKTCLLIPLSSAIFFGVFFWFGTYLLKYLIITTIDPPDLIGILLMSGIWFLFFFPYSVYSWNKNEKEFLKYSEDSDE